MAKELVKYKELHELELYLVHVTFILLNYSSHTHSEHDNVGYSVGYDMGPTNRTAQNEQEAAILDEQLKAEKRKEAWEEMQATSSKDIEERFKIKRGVNAPISQQKAMLQVRMVLKRKSFQSRITLYPGVKLWTTSVKARMYFDQDHNWGGPGVRVACEL